MNICIYIAKFASNVSSFKEKISIVFKTTIKKIVLICLKPEFVSLSSDVIFRSKIESV